MSGLLAAVTATGALSCAVIVVGLLVLTLPATRRGGGSWESRSQTLLGALVVAIGVFLLLQLR